MNSSILKSIAITSLLILALSSCKNPGANTNTSNASATAPEGFDVNGIPEDVVSMLLQQGDHIDYIFNTLPLSMNQSGNQSVYQDMTFVSSAPMSGVLDGCSPLARKIYFSKGEIILEADLYYSDNCLFQIFIMDEKMLYGNMLSQEGVTFYNNLMAQAQQTMPNNLK